MPNRIVRDGINKSEVIDRLDPPEEVFFRRLLNEHDDFGRFYGDPRLLRSALYPKRSNRIREADVTRWRDGCVAAGAIVLFIVNGEPFVVVLKTDKPRAKRSKFPQPPSGVRCWRGSGEFIELGINVLDEDNIAANTCAHMRARTESNPSLSLERRGSGRGEDPLLPFAQPQGTARTVRPESSAERTRRMLEQELKGDNA